MHHTHAAVVLREIEGTSPVLSLVLITGTDRAADTIAFAIVDVMGGVLFGTENLLRGQVMAQDPRMLKALNTFGTIWGFKASDFLRHLVRHDPAFKQAS